MKKASANIGDIYRMTTKQGDRYLQLIAIHDLGGGSDVVAIFKQPGETIGKSMRVAEIPRWPVDYYIHTLVEVGAEMGLWQKVGEASVRVDSGRLRFKSYEDEEMGQIMEAVATKGLMSSLPVPYPHWKVWSVGDSEFSYVTEAEGMTLAAMEGATYSPEHVIRQTENGVGLVDHGWPKGSVEGPAKLTKKSLLSKIFTKKKPAPTPEAKPEQAMIISFAAPKSFNSEELLNYVNGLEDQLNDVLESSRAGGWDGHDVGDGEVTIYLYGANADQLFQLTEPVLRKASTKPFRVTLRYGAAKDTNVKERTQTINP